MPMTDAGQPHRNRLANETSPYLLQHADNPVDWFPWGDEAFARARAEDKPVLLSVGYSSCHWCHVMAHESFENPEIAALMNQWFVNVKVDREERPDVDGVYMTVVQGMTGSGGWPMTVFLTPEGEPFYAGTYFPPQDMHGRPGFPKVLEALQNAWTNEREKVVESAAHITTQLREGSRRSASGDGVVDATVADSAANRYREAFDPEWGGFGGAPKFPSPSNLEFLLEYHARLVAEGRPDPGALFLVTETLRHMASGGIYDHLGGGFARYSVDGAWVVPHFEKMLYDNAQLIRTYLHAWQLTGDPLHERIVRETIAYLEREMLDPSGGFYSAQDADSEGIEGKFYVFTVSEVEEALGADTALFNRCFGVTPSGNFHDPHHPELVGRTVLTRRYDETNIAREFGISGDALESRLDELREQLFKVRQHRVPPGLDDKVLTSWNGLALAALAEAARVLGDQHYHELAIRNAAFVRQAMWDGARLLHTWKGGVARIDGMLEDYVFYGLGLIELYKLTGDLAHLEWARELWEIVLRDFRDGENGGFFEASRSGEKLLFDQKSFFDAATPSGNGSAAQLGWWLGRYYDRPEWEAVVHEVVAQVQQHLLSAVTGFGAIWQAIELIHAPRQELVIAGEPGARAPLETEAARRYLPWLLVAPGAAGTPLPHFEGRDAGDAALAYFCENMACQLPVAMPEELAHQLDAACGTP
jgi:uncharacterized protein